MREGWRKGANVMRLGMPMTARVWFNTKIDLGAAVFFSLFNVVLNQFYVAFAIQNGASNMQVGILTAAPAFGLIFAPLWAGWIEQSSDVKKFTIVPNVIGRALLVLPAFFPHPWVFVATMIVFHLLMGIQAPAYAALISRIYPTEIRGRLMSYTRVAMGSLMIPIAYGVGSWSQAMGSQGPLLAASVAGLISVFLFSYLRVPKQAKQPARKIKAGFHFGEQWKLIKSNKLLAVFLLATTFAGFGNMLSVPLYQIIQVDILQMSNMQIGYARVAYFTALLLTFLAAGWLLDRFDAKYTLMAGIGAYAIVPLIYGVWGNYSAVLVGNAIQGVGEAIWDIGILSFVLRLVPGREAMVFSIHLMLFGVRGSVGPLLSTSLTSSLSMSTLLLTASLLATIGTVLFVVGTAKMRNPDEYEVLAG